VSVSEASHKALASMLASTHLIDDAGEVRGRLDLRFRNGQRLAADNTHGNVQTGHWNLSS
jgi:hypothetical protein